MSAYPIVDGEWSRTPAQEGLWLTIDGLGTKRNICAAVGAGSQIARASAKIVRICGGGIVPFLQMLGGVLVLGSALFHTIPNAHKEYQTAEQEYKQLGPNNRYAKEGIHLAKLGLANQYLFGTMGAGLASAGTITLLSPIGAGLLGFAPLVSSATAVSAGTILGGIYLVRGGIIWGRAISHLQALTRFEKDYKDSLRLSKKKNLESLQRSVERALQNIKTIGIGTCGLQRRIGDEPKLPLHASLGQKIQYLEAVDKGIHMKKLQQKISLVVGGAMIVGGLTTIAAAVIFFTGGLALPIVALISSIFFAAMEGIYATYDSRFLLEKVRKCFYTPSKEIEEIKTLHRDLTVQEARQRNQNLYNQNRQLRLQRYQARLRDYLSTAFV